MTGWTGDGDGPGDTLRVLLPAKTSKTPPERALGVIELGGEPWLLEELTQRSAAERNVAYTCVSYSWGTQRRPHALSPRFTMSDRALGAAECALQLVAPAALWLDAFCVPLDGTERASCLKRMGQIYAQAAQVVVVLSAPCHRLLEQIHGAKGIDQPALDIFEADEWVTRAWTYQEVVNSKKLFFVAEGSRERPVDGQEFFNHVGHRMMRYKMEHQKTAFEMHLEYPRADALENLMADWLMAGFLERTAYQILSSMYGRKSERPEDFFLALLGALSAPSEEKHDPSQHPAELFMRACEEKGDFSFIYSSAPRSGPSWRPAPGPMQALFPWHTFGAGQPGQLHADHLTLDNMHRIELGPLDSAAEEVVATTWRSGYQTTPATKHTATTIQGCLEQAGFSGTGAVVSLREGYFFPDVRVSDLSHVFAVISTSLVWMGGALGLLLRQRDRETPEYVAVGVFVGAAARAGEPIDVAHLQT